MVISAADDYDAYDNVDLCRWKWSGFKKNCLITTYKLYLCGTAVTILFNYLFNYLIPDERLSFIGAVSIHWQVSLR